LAANPAQPTAQPAAVAPQSCAKLVAPNANFATCLDLRGADLRSARLMDAILSRANLQGANLEYAHLEGALLQDAILTDVAASGASLVGATLKNTALGGVVLEKAKLTRAILDSVDMRKSRLDGAQLDQASLRYIDTTDGASFVGVDFTEAGIKWCKFLAADFRAARFKGAHTALPRSATHCRGTTLAGSLPGTSLQARFRDVAFERCTFDSRTVFTGATFDGEVEMERAMADGARALAGSRQMSFLRRRPTPSPFPFL